MKEKKSFIYGISAVLLWSTVATAFKLALRELEVSQLLLISSVVSFFVLLIIALISTDRQQLFRQSPRDIAMSFIMGALNPFAYYLCLFAAYDRLPAQEALSLNYSWAIALALLSVPLLKQKLSLKGLLFLLLSFFGVVIIAFRGDFTSAKFSDTLGVSLALISSLIWALYWILNIRDARDTVVKLCTNFFFGSLFIIIYSAVIGKLNVPNVSGALSATYIGLFEMGITFVLWLTALKSSKSNAKLNSLVYLSPFISLMLIALILKEPIYISTLVGLVFILTGIVLQKRV